MRFLQIRSACGWMFERKVRAFWLAASEFPKEQARISDLQKTLSKMRSANFKYNKSFFSGSFCLIHESLPSKSKFFTYSRSTTTLHFFLQKAIPYARISFRPSFLNRSSYRRSRICCIAFSQALGSP